MKKFDWTYILRFIRVIVPQLPAISAYVLGWKPEWAAELAFVGAVLTALDKYARDKGTYDKVAERIGL